MGNYGWSYAEVLPFFKKSENMMDPKAAKDETYHATGGPLNVEYAGYGTKIAGTGAQINPEYIYFCFVQKLFVKKRCQNGYSY
jgi:choline dehydrogenase-like flavoprotein